MTSLSVSINLRGASREADCLDCLVGLPLAIDCMRSAGDDHEIPHKMIEKTLNAFGALVGRERRAMLLAVAGCQDLLYRHIANLTVMDRYTKSYFIPVSYTHLDVYKRQLSARQDIRKRLVGDDEARVENAVELIEELHSRLFTERLINYYESKESSYARVVEIFIRTNTGGKKLEYSDILLSIATATWKSQTPVSYTHLDVYKRQGTS